MAVEHMPENRLPKAVKIAKEEHHCWKCGRLIKKGDRFTMRIDRDGGSFNTHPTCLKCDGRGYDKRYDETGV
jgi:RNase P subunit RPR2